MPQPIIKVENLSKNFIIRHEANSGGRYTSLREVITEKIKRLGKKKVEPFSQQEEFWALQDVSFSVEQSNRVGIIGRNGAGKSTLLKILSQITEPTSGSVRIKGRVASLLEVGTGFHPELTGRENIFLNGAILGMSRAEIRGKFDEIVAFAETEKFLDTPVKRYSSGMYVRLAFAVAAHLEPEILIVDEVLSVGDVEFQKKCLGKMKDVASHGRTVIFVSHNMTAVNSLCQTCIYLSGGRIKSIGKTDAIINDYLSSESLYGTERQWTSRMPGDEVAVLHAARIINKDHKKIETIYIHQPIGIEFDYEILKPGFKPIPNIHIFTNRGETAFVSGENNIDIFSRTGRFKSIMWIPPNLLNENTYIVGLALSTISPLKVHFFEVEALMFNAIENLSLRESDYNQPFPGVVRPSLKWQTELKN